MIYNEFLDMKLSALGFGAMRMPTADGDFSQIIEAEAEKMVDYAMEHGVNYYDTAWGYHNGNSEVVLGKLLGKYPRESFYLANKFPGYDLANMDKVEEIFEAQLKKCGVEYFDFYLFHNVCELNINEYLDPKYRILDYLLQQKKNGRIRHLGFSTHATLENMKRFLEAYGEHMEFCQLQINWLDWSFQNAKGKVELVKEYGIPIWVMEPLRGGSLAKQSPDHEAKLKKLHPDWSIPEWAFRFLQGIEGVSVTLSGMSDFKQIQENIAAYETLSPLTCQDMNALSEIAEEMLSQKTLPCTACRYCTAHCPQELNIPWLLELYNEHIYTKKSFISIMAVSSLPQDKRPAACIGCKSCEAVCPQQIKISDAMKDYSAILKEDMR